jgi:hypothetical protein
MNLELCRNLCWKSITRELDEPEEILAAFARNQVPYTCLETCRNAGPDDDLVAPELCQAGRECYRPSALSLRLRARGTEE